MITRFEQFSASVACIYRNIQKIERVEMAKYGLKGPHAQALLAMSHHPEGVTSGELVKLCDKDKAAISRVVSELEKKNLLIREYAGSSAYRARLKLTDAGRTAAQFVSRRAQTAVEIAGQGLTDADRRIFYATLERIACNLQTICAEGIPVDQTR